MNSFDHSHFIPTNIVHGTIGTIITGLAIFQFVLGILRPHQPEGYKKGEPKHAKPSCAQALQGKSSTEYTAIRLIWERKHRWLGRTLFIAAAVNITIGIGLLFGGLPTIPTLTKAILVVYWAYLLSKTIVYIVCDAKNRKWLCCKSGAEVIGL